MPVKLTERVSPSSSAKVTLVPEPPTLTVPLLQVKKFTSVHAVELAVDESPPFSAKVKVLGKSDEIVGISFISLTAIDIAWDDVLVPSETLAEIE